MSTKISLFYTHTISRLVKYCLTFETVPISRDLRRPSGEYKACVVQENYQTARIHLHNPSVLSKIPAVRTKIATHLKSKHIANISFNTIYRYIEKYNLGLPFTSYGDTGVRRHLRYNDTDNIKKKVENM